MRHEWTKVTVDGYGADEWDFEARLAASSQAIRDQVDNEIMSPLFNATGGAVLIIEGFADRIDTGDHATNSERETQASADRWRSAQDTILMMIGRDWIDPPPADWDELPYIGLFSTAMGASILIDPGTSEAAARRNRRVVLQVCRFIDD